MPDEIAAPTDPAAPQLAIALQVVHHRRCEAVGCQRRRAVWQLRAALRAEGALMHPVTDAAAAVDVPGSERDR